MANFSAFATLAGSEPAHALGESLEHMVPEPTAIGVIEVEDGSGTWEVAAYFSERPDVAGLALLASMHQASDFVVSRIEDRDWVAQVRRELHPVDAGRFTVYGAHDSHRIGAHRIGLKIEAAMAFGTGHHGTTRGCLTLLDRLARQGWRARRVADVGCGTGVLAMAAAKLWRVPCVATDIDSQAVATTRENLIANGVAPFVRLGCGPGFQHDALRHAAPFDLVFANILAGPLKRMAPKFAMHVAPGGHAILSGLLSAQSPSVEAIFRGHGFTRADRVRLGDWTSLLLRKE